MTDPTLTSGPTDRQIENRIGELMVRRRISRHAATGVVLHEFAATLSMDSGTGTDAADEASAWALAR